MPQPTTKKEQASLNRLEFLYELYNKGVPIKDEEMALLKEKGFLAKTPGSFEKEEELVDDEAVIFSSELSKKADQIINIIHGEPGKSKGIVDVSFNEDVEADIKSRLFYGADKEILKEDWMPESKIYHKQDFVDWIDSINNGFQKMVKYGKFELYCKQAEIWLSENTNIRDFNTRSERQAFIINELSRCDTNSIYFLNKYLKVKEADLVNGQMDYDAKPVHKVLCYIFDCGYSFSGGKPRQIAATTTIGGLALKRLCLNRNYFVKFIAQDDQKVKEIFDDKVKYPFSELPAWFRPSTFNDRENMISFKSKKQKGKIKGLNSVLRVVAPSIAAINGGSPSLVLVDEAGYIGILGKMLKEARPTLFRQNPITKLIEMTRQIIFWGTGGEMDKGGKSFEDEFMNCIKKWRDMDYEYGIIPLFFDWTTRPGMTQEQYDKELRAYTVDGPDKEEKMVQFRQAYPSVIEDMFLSSHKTLLSANFINRQIEKINKMDHRAKPIYGYFEPIYDEASPSHERSDTPFKIIGAEFIPTDGLSKKTSTIMFMPPNHGYRNRYFQGTDPIASDNGVSKMASAVWDKHYGTVACVVNYRDGNHKNAFLQCYLMSLFYNVNGKNKRIPELGEANIGQNYFDYVEEKGGADTLLYNGELLPSLRGGGQLIGVDNHRGRSRIIINFMSECFTTYGENILVREIWDQHRTFVCTVSDDMNEIWGSMDKKKYPDDILYAVTYSYICALSVSDTPIEIESERVKTKLVYELKRDRNGNLTRVPVKKR